MAVICRANITHVITIVYGLSSDFLGVVVSADAGSLRACKVAVVSQSKGLRRRGFCGFVVAGDCPQGNSQAIPQIDSPDHEGQVHDFFFTEMRL